MNSKKITHLAVIGLLLGTILFSLVPVVQTLLKGSWRSVPPGYVDDDLYYYGRIKEVADGRPFLGNPYFIEYRDARSTAFFVADWLAAIPLLLGIPLSLGIVLNLVFWSLLFVVFAYRVIRTTDLPSPLSAGLAFIAYCEVYWMIFRPVAMQEVFPFFLLFLLVFLGWLRNPSNRRSIWFLIIASALPFYIYTYLWQIVFTTISVAFIHFVWQKKWLEVQALVYVALGTGLLSLPVIIYTFYQIHAPFYWETMGRIALVESHLPVMDAYRYGRWAILLALLYFCIQRWQKNGTSAEAGGSSVLTSGVIYSGLGLFIMTIGNVFIGKDLATAQHIGRFITLWVALFFPILMWRLWMRRKEVLRWNWFRLSAIGLLSLACLGFLVLNLKRALPFQKIAAMDSVRVQAYAVPLDWLEEREQRPIVVWANEEISTYVPILTKHYVFWNRLGSLHLMPTKEVEDRFLASQVKILNTDELFAAYERIEGAGPGWRYSDAFYKNKIQCAVHGDCHPDQSFREWIGDAKLDSLLKREIELKKNISVVMKQYHVAYIIADTSKVNEDSYFKSLPGTRPIWKDDRFVIYEIH